MVTRFWPLHSVVLICFLPSTGLLRVLDDLERYARSTSDPEALKAVQECKASLDKLVTKMDSLEAGFDRIAERSLLSASRLSLSRRRSQSISPPLSTIIINGIKTAIEAEEQAYHELVEELRISREANARQDAVFQEERNALQSEIRRLKLSLQDVDSSASTEQGRAARLEREVHQVRAQLEGEITARRIVEERNSELQADIESQRIAIARALADATEQSKAAQRSRQELEQVQSEFDQMKELVSQNESKISLLVEDQSRNLRNLEDARARGENLELQIQAVQGESEEVRQALRATSQEKDRLLKLQATEHDRIIRDHIAEADGDRAVLERQFHELKNYQEGLEREVKNLKADIEVANADAVGLREELQRVEHELREARHVERILRDDLKAGRASQSDFDQRTENSTRLIAQILDVAICFRNSHVKALQTAQAMSSHPASKHANMLAESMTFSPGLRIGHHDEPSPIDPSDPAAALEILRELDHDVFLEAVAKTGSTIRKWQKQCREYRERAKGKISFRNFAKGDLAMFLPTRNSVSKPWAAFNGVFFFFSPFLILILLFHSLLPALLLASHGSPS
jgi:autophagy-related protein 11